MGRPGRRVVGASLQKHSDGICDKSGVEAKGSLRDVNGVGAQKSSEGIGNNSGISRSRPADPF